MKPQRLPVAVVRDLLGVCRSLYRARAAAAAPHAELQRIAELGVMLTRALAMSKAPPNSMGQRAAWRWAEQGLAGLSELLFRSDESTRGLVTALGVRLRKEK